MSHHEALTLQGSFREGFPTVAGATIGPDYGALAGLGSRSPRYSGLPGGR
jgi:hypothetical protein